MLSLQDYRNYKQNRARFTENNFSLLRSKIRKLHPIHRASLRALLRHLLRVSSHSDTNATIRGGARWLSLLCCPSWEYDLGRRCSREGMLYRPLVTLFQLIPSKGLVLDDLIQNVHTLFDDRPPPPPHYPSPHMAETTSTYTYGSFLTPESPPLAEVQPMGSTTRHRPTPGLVGCTHMESRLAPLPTSLLNPIQGCPSSQTPTGRSGDDDARAGRAGGERHQGGWDIGELHSSGSCVRSAHICRRAVASSPSDSVLYSTSDFPLSSATSLRTARPFST
ncbi:hypothetical protein EDB83DRAFT_1409823 [Lactarius deliciosus]|nr:hypothetical protein EDB83DRAFT_1409823 [Lactarius deliciosus]